MDDSDAAVAGGDADADVEDPSKEEDVEEVFFFPQHAKCRLHLISFDCEPAPAPSFPLSGMGQNCNGPLGHSV